MNSIKYLILKKNLLLNKFYEFISISIYLLLKEKDKFDKRNQ